MIEVIRRREEEGQPKIKARRNIGKESPSQDERNIIRSHRRSQLQPKGGQLRGYRDERPKYSEDPIHFSLTTEGN